MECRVWVLGFRGLGDLQGLGFEVWVLRVCDLGAWGFGFGALGFGVWGSEVWGAQGEGSCGKSGVVLRSIGFQRTLFGDDLGS